MTIKEKVNVNFSTRVTLLLSGTTFYPPFSFFLAFSVFSIMTSEYDGGFLSGGESGGEAPTHGGGPSTNTPPPPTGKLLFDAYHLNESYQNIFENPCTSLKGEATR